MLCQQITVWCQLALCWLLSGLSSFLPLAGCLPQNANTDALFNRWCIRYTSASPLAGEISYCVGSCQKSEVFFLEAAAEPAEFSCFIDGFLDGTLARDPAAPSFRVLDGSEAAYAIESVAVEWVRPPKGESLLLEDALCQAGINLRWGGALELFTWKTAPAGYGNLLNRHDAGRLVQQSYYGTDQLPYVQGNYSGTAWGYNPVQGGDQYGNRSKLVDYRVEDGQIYIKCRPMDWSKNGELTPSYMENTYTLQDGVLTVENRFVDFSGLTHPARHQEMPAFYVVSALGTFNFYDGAQPWQNAALTQKSDLPFWGGGVADCYFDLNPANTETWCAWTAGTQPDAFGCGVFNPAAEILLAGRAGTSGSADPNSDATNYFAALRTLQLQSYQALEYSYCITAGTLEQMRAKFAALR
ncbi:MAG: hypothetical protein LBS96_01980 [Oscillospiraceae bacterium]|jgi:hypothetical protein|nr:hypothetical protein [Oscillospiraceae bacterium]